MGRLKISSENKAFSTTFSIKPSHEQMIDDLKKAMNTDKSGVIQKLIENAHKSINK